MENDVTHVEKQKTSSEIKKIVEKSACNEITEDFIKSFPYGKQSDRTYVKPIFKDLTQEEIDDIHARSMITAAEKVKETEDMGLCAPGDAIGSAGWRCHKFKNCHDCLVEYYGDRDEYHSFSWILDEMAKNRGDKITKSL